MLKRNKPPAHIIDKFIEEWFIDDGEIRDISFKTINVYSETHVVNKIGCTIAVALLLKV